MDTILYHRIVSNEITCLKHPKKQLVQGQYSINISSVVLLWLTETGKGVMVKSHAV